jgi:LynF/TruF/PatF family peptide O-prenyltransferase
MAIRPRGIHGAYCRAFRIRSTLALKAFEALMAQRHQCVEYSTKIDRSNVHCYRMAVYFDTEIPKRLRAIEKSLDGIAQIRGVALDPRLFERVMRGLDLDRVGFCAFGIDWRERLIDSRVKVWWSVVDQPGKVRDLVEAHGGDDSVRRLVRVGLLLVGTDLTLDGSTRLKLYPKYNLADLLDPSVRRRLRQVLSPAAIAWMSRARRTNVSFEPDGRRTLHFLPVDPKALLGELRNPCVRRLDSQYNALGLRLNVVSLLESELDTRRHDHLNLYYTP